MQRWTGTDLARGSLRAMVLAAGIVGVYGCMALIPGMSDVAEPGNVFNGYMTAKSTVEIESCERTVVSRAGATGDAAGPRPSGQTRPTQE